MGLKQLSVFIENREGRICDVTQVIKDADINIITVSLADTADYGMVRMLVSEPERCLEALKEAGFSAMLVDVIAVKVGNQAGELHDFLKLLVEAGISIEYMYTMAVASKTAIILKVSDPGMAGKVLLQHGYELVVG